MGTDRGKIAIVSIDWAVGNISLKFTGVYLNFVSILSSRRYTMLVIEHYTALVRYCAADLFKANHGENSVPGVLRQENMVPSSTTKAFSTASLMKIMALLGDRLGDSLHINRERKQKNISSFHGDIEV